MTSRSLSRARTAFSLLEYVACLLPTLPRSLSAALLVTKLVSTAGQTQLIGEMFACATGLDVEEKFDTLRLQINKSLGEEGLAQFTTFDMTQYGVAKKNPNNEAEGTALMRIFAQAKSLDAFGPTKNLMRIMNPEGLGHFPGFHWQMDYRSECTPSIALIASFRPGSIHRVLARSRTPEVSPPHCWLHWIREDSDCPSCRCH